MQKTRELKHIWRMNQEYPERLTELMDAPTQLYYYGNLPRNDRKTVGIVGARMCSAYGKNQAFEFAKVLAEYGVQIISGMARGIDSAAHEGALAAKGETFAILGCGVDICYPRENEILYQNILKQGGVLSELPPQTPPIARNFPLRNRIISGLSDILLVVEAKEKSGSLITVDCALEQGKSVFAVPGRICDELSKGCNHLISQGASIAETPESILEELHINTVKDAEEAKKNEIRLASDLELVYSGLDLQAQNLNQILAKVPYNIQELSEILLKLQLKGLVIEPAKNYYARAK